MLGLVKWIALAYGFWATSCRSWRWLQHWGWALILLPSARIAHCTSELLLQMQSQIQKTHGIASLWMHSLPEGILWNELEINVSYYNPLWSWVLCYVAKLTDILPNISFIHKITNIQNSVGLAWAVMRVIFSLGTDIYLGEVDQRDMCV
jgi:hypothetical protein